jgi:DNA-binding NtrC family response regulator
MKRLSESPVLLVADEPQLCDTANTALCTAGFPHVLTVKDGRDIPRLLTLREVSVIVLDLPMTGVPGRVILDQVAADYPDIPIVVITAITDLDVAMECMRAGAIGYLIKPVEQGRLASAVRNAFENRPLCPELLELKKRFHKGESRQSDALAEIVTQDRAMYAIFSYLEAIARSPLPVLIAGETGTGKELVASKLHRLSERPGEFVAVNVAGLDDALFSDTLFGHERGAYTGADRQREGLITAAADGTLFLDEVGDLPGPAQVKLLRLLQEGTYYALGADRPRKSRARVVVATNRDLDQCVAAGTFRKDLYFRLVTHQLRLPPLRERRDDLPLVLQHFIDDAARVLEKPAPKIPYSLLALLQTYDFPGNLRELQAMVFDAVARHKIGRLSLQSFKNWIDARTSRPIDTRPSSDPGLATLFPDRLPTLREVEDSLTNEAMARANNNQGVAAGILGISRQALNKRLGRRRNSSS